MTPEASEILREQLEEDQRIQVEWAEHASQLCRDCAWSHYFPKYGNSKLFAARVDNMNGLGVCAFGGDYVGITTADTALSMDCDAWEPVD